MGPPRPDDAAARRLWRPRLEPPRRFSTNCLREGPRKGLGGPAAGRWGRAGPRRAGRMAPSTPPTPFSGWGIYVACSTPPGSGGERHRLGWGVRSPLSPETTFMLELTPRGGGPRAAGSPEPTMRLRPSWSGAQSTRDRRIAGRALPRTPGQARKRAALPWTKDVRGVAGSREFRGNSLSLLTVHPGGRARQSRFQGTWTPGPFFSLPLRPRQGPTRASSRARPTTRRPFPWTRRRRSCRAPSRPSGDRP